MGLKPEPNTIQALHRTPYSIQVIGHRPWFVPKIFWQWMCRSCIEVTIYSREEYVIPWPPSMR